MEQNFSHKCIADQSSLITDEARGEILCSECGSVIAEKMTDSQYANRTFSKEGYMNKTRAEGKSMLSFHDKGISSVIGKHDKDVNGNFIGNNMKTKFARMRIWDSRSKAKGKERSMMKAFQFLDAVKPKLGLPESIVEKASYFFRKASEMNLIKGRSIEAIMAVSIYAACREAGTPRNIDELSKVSGIKRKIISKTYRHIFKKIKIDTEPPDPKGFVSKVATEAGTSEKTKRLALKFLDDAHKKHITVSKKPAGLAGSAVYLAAALNGEKITYSILEKITHTSAVTLRKLVKLFMQKLNSPELEGLR